MVDFSGQETVEFYYQSILTTSAVIGFVVGFILQSFIVTVYCIGGGVLISAAICLPNWPFLNRNPVQWQPNSAASSSSSSNTTTTTSSSSTSNKGGKGKKKRA